MGLGGLASLFSAAGGPAMDLVSMNASKKAADRQYKRELAMSNTAHQREVADLKAAGLNPILSAGGGGASTPGVQMAHIPDLSKGMTSGMNTAMAVKQATANVRATNAGAETMEVDARLARDMLKFYESNTAVREAVQAGLLAGKAGISPTLGAGVRTIGDTVERIKRGLGFGGATSEKFREVPGSRKPDGSSDIRMTLRK